jgi:hypothetical protein
MSWRNKKLAPVLTAQNSIAAKAVAREPTNQSPASNKSNKANFLSS